MTKFKDMQMVFVPKGLKRAIQALALCVPLAAFEVILVKRAPWWRLPYQQIGYVCVPVFVVSVIISILLLKGRRIGWYALAVLASFWFLSNGWMALRLHYPSLGIYGLVLGGLMLAHLSWLKLELGRSFIDPKMHWYEGLPQPVPGLNCEINLQSERNEYRVARLDREGVFVFRDNSRGTTPTGEKFVKPENVELLLSFREKQTRCVGVPVCVFNRMGSESVIGFKFRDMSADSRKLLGDFVEALKGEGYVS
ncbi:MAG: hypothetical protein ACJ763_16920 [Bdellovibrionia bacterium]